MENINYSDVLKKVTAALEKIRPFLQADGGDINLVEVTEDLVVKVQLTGACGSCPYSLMTLKNGVEQTIRREIPEIKSVEQA